MPENSIEILQRFNQLGRDADGNKIASLTQSDIATSAEDDTRLDEKIKSIEASIANNPGGGGAPTQEQVNEAIAGYESVSPYAIWTKFIGTTFTYNDQGMAVDKAGNILDPQPPPLRQKATPVIVPQEVNLLTDADFAFTADPADGTKRAIVWEFIPTTNLPARLTADREFNTAFEGSIELETENAQSRTVVRLAVRSVHRAGLATEFSSERFSTRKAGNITAFTIDLTGFSTPVAFTQAQLDANPPLGDTEPFKMLFVLRVFDQLTNAQLDGFPAGTTQAIMRTNRIGVRFKLDASNIRPASTDQPADLTAVNNRLTAVENKNSNQDASITANTNKNSAQDASITAIQGRLTAIEGMDSSQNAAILANTDAINTIPERRTDAEIKAISDASVQAQNSIDAASIEGNKLTLTSRDGGTQEYTPTVNEGGGTAQFTEGEATELKAIASTTSVNNGVVSADRNFLVSPSLVRNSERQVAGTDVSQRIQGDVIASGNFTINLAANLPAVPIGIIKLAMQIQSSSQDIVEVSDVRFELVQGANTYTVGGGGSLFDNDEIFDLVDRPILLTVSEEVLAGATLRLVGNYYLRYGADRTYSFTKIILDIQHIGVLHTPIEEIAIEVARDILNENPTQTGITFDTQAQKDEVIRKVQDLQYSHDTPQPIQFLLYNPTTQVFTVPTVDNGQFTLANDGAIVYNRQQAVKGAFIRNANNEVTDLSHLVFQSFSNPSTFTGDFYAVRLSAGTYSQPYTLAPNTADPLQIQARATALEGKVQGLSTNLSDIQAEIDDIEQKTDIIEVTESVDTTYSYNGAGLIDTAYTVVEEERSFSAPLNTQTITAIASTPTIQGQLAYGSFRTQGAGATPIVFSIDDLASGGVDIDILRVNENTNNLEYLRQIPATPAGSAPVSLTTANGFITPTLVFGRQIPGTNQYQSEDDEVVFTQGLPSGTQTVNIVFSPTVNNPLPPVSTTVTRGANKQVVLAPAGVGTVGTIDIIWTSTALEVRMNRDSSTNNPAVNRGSMTVTGTWTNPTAIPAQSARTEWTALPTLSLNVGSNNIALYPFFRENDTTLSFGIALNHVVQVIDTGIVINPRDNYSYIFGGSDLIMSMLYQRVTPSGAGGAVIAEGTDLYIEFIRALIAEAESSTDPYLGKRVANNRQETDFDINAVIYGLDSQGTQRQNSYFVPLTQAQYDALPAAQQNATDILYIIQG